MIYLIVFHLELEYKCSYFPIIAGYFMCFLSAISINIFTGFSCAGDDSNYQVYLNQIVMRGQL